MNVFEFHEEFWRRHPAVAIAVFALLLLVAVLACQLDQSGSAVVYQNF